MIKKEETYINKLIAAAIISINLAVAFAGGHSAHSGHGIGVTVDKKQVKQVLLCTFNRRQMTFRYMTIHKKVGQRLSRPYVIAPWCLRQISNNLRVAL